MPTKYTGLGIGYPDGPDLHPSKPWWQTLAVTTDAAIKEHVAAESLLKGALEAGTDLNDVVLTGEYEIPNAAIAASLLNAPTPLPVGVLSVATTANGLVTQQFTPTPLGGQYLRTRTASGTWSAWSQTSSTFVRGTLVGGENLNSYSGGLTYRGQWAVPQSAVDVGVQNLPTNVPGLLDVISPIATNPLQVYYSWEAQPRIWIRGSTGATGSTFQAWQLVGGGATSGGRDVGQANAVLQEAFRRRRGGSIGTAGKAVVALRFDHNTNDFQSKVLPLLRQHSLPASLALPADELNPTYPDHSTGITWADIQAMVLTNGIEVHSHSFTHTDAASPEQLKHEIVDSRAYLMAQMSQVIVEGWMMVGVGGSYYDGFGPIDTPEKLIDTIAGRLIMSTYAVTSGHIGGYQRPLDGANGQGLAHFSIDDEPDATATLAAIADAEMLGTGLVIMVHPDNVGAAGRIPSAAFAQILAHLAAERDAGRIEVLTVGGMGLADPTKATRHDLLIDGRFTAGMGRWSGTGWTATAEGVQSPSTGVALRQSRSLRQQAWALGAVREIQVRVRSTAGATVSVRAVTTNYGSLDATRTYTVPAGTGWTILRMHVTLPYTPGTTPAVNLAVEISVASGQTVEVAEAHAYSA